MHQVRPCVKVAIMTNEEVRVRAATADDTAILAAAALEAMNWDGSRRFTQGELTTNPNISRYLGASTAALDRIQQDPRVRVLQRCPL